MYGFLVIIRSYGSGTPMSCMLSICGVLSDPNGLVIDTITKTSNYTNTADQCRQIRIGNNGSTYPTFIDYNITGSTPKSNSYSVWLSLMGYLDEPLDTSITSHIDESVLPSAPSTTITTYTIIQ